MSRIGLSGQQALLALRDVGAVMTRKGQQTDAVFAHLFDHGLAFRELKGPGGERASNGSWHTAHHRLTPLGRAQAEELARSVASNGW